MHIFWYVNRTCTHEVTGHHEWLRIQSSIHYITKLWCTQVKISQYMDIGYASLKVSCVSFPVFLLVAKCPVFISFPLQHNHCKQTEEWKLHFARKCLSRKWGIKHGKMCQALRWPTSLKCKSKLAVAKPQENAGHWRILSLPSNTHTHMHKTNHFILFTFFGVMISSWA